MRKRQRHDTLTTQPSLDNPPPLAGRLQRQQQPQPQPGSPLHHFPCETAAADPVILRQSLHLPGIRNDSALINDQQHPTPNTGCNDNITDAANSGNGHGALYKSSQSDSTGVQVSDPGTPTPSQQCLAAAVIQDPQGQEGQPMTRQSVELDHAGQPGSGFQITDPAADSFSSTSPRRTGLWHAIVKALYKGWMDYNSLVWREYIGLLRNPCDAAGRILTFVWLAMISNYITYSLPLATKY
ncbi:MAG: hypothetical protein WDW38_007241 [Sanguina aurantia]